MSVLAVWFGTTICLPTAIWMWREAIVNLVSDCIAEGIRKSREP